MLKNMFDKYDIYDIMNFVGGTGGIHTGFKGLGTGMRKGRDNLNKYNAGYLNPFAFLEGITGYDENATNDARKRGEEEDMSIAEIFQSLFSGNKQY